MLAYYLTQTLRQHKVRGRGWRWWAGGAGVERLGGASAWGEAGRLWIAAGQWSRFADRLGGGEKRSKSYVRFVGGRLADELWREDGG